jgi:hypothetical protein
MASLIRSGADVNLANVFGYTPLDSAILAVFRSRMMYHVIALLEMNNAQSTLRDRQEYLGCSYYVQGIIGIRNSTNYETAVVKILADSQEGARAQERTRSLLAAMDEESEYEESEYEESEEINNIEDDSKNDSDSKNDDANELSEDDQ